MATEDGIAVEEWRAALKKALDSEIFSGSRRLSDFVAYSGNAAIEGRSELDQYEIAEKVLGRASDFNPWDDAAVRKLATQLRHKLEEYYAGPGASDRIVISLPRRSYVLRFRTREEEPASGAPTDSPELAAAEPEPAPAPPLEQPLRAPAAAGRPAWQWVLVGAAMGAAPALAWLLARGWAPGGSPGMALGAPSRVIIDTQRGDLRGKELDVARDAVRIGPVLGEGEDATVRLRFTPEHSTQQAGLMAMYDPDNYVRLGPHFKNRTLMEFGSEREGVYQGLASTYEFDPLGQAEHPRWLALRRAGPDYTAYLSSDGFAWRPFGSKLTLPDTSRDLKAAVYAFNGRSANPPARAVFEHFGTGIAFHNRPEGPFRVADFPGWELREECKTPASVTVAEGVLRVGFAPEAMGCSWSLTRAAPPGDWAFSTLVDVQAVFGSAFCIVVRGSKVASRLSRRDLGGGSLQLEREYDRDTRIPDFPGAPPVVLRVEKRGGIIRAGVSRDLDTFTILPGEEKTEDLGNIRQLGVQVLIAHWTSQLARPPARIYWVRLEPITPDYLVRRNVP
jgi:hypothetical protein